MWMQKIRTYYAIGIVFVFLISLLFVSGHSGLLDKVYSISKISQSENEEIYKIQEIVAQNQNEAITSGFPLLCISYLKALSSAVRL